MYDYKNIFQFFAFRLPEEGPMPQPAVGMRLSKWPDTARYLLGYEMMIFFLFLPNSVSQTSLLGTQMTSFELKNTTPLDPDMCSKFYNLQPRILNLP